MRNERLKGPLEIVTLVTVCIKDFKENITYLEGSNELMTTF